MKKTLTLLAITGMFAFYACGPSAEQRAAADKAKQDSIAAVEQAKQDSIAAADAAAMQQAAQDTVKQDSTVQQHH